MKIRINSSQITPSNFECGDVLLDQRTGDQYCVEDVNAESQFAILRKLESEEKNKPMYTDGTVDIVPQPAEVDTSSEDEEYIAKYLPLHLIGAGEIDELRELMKDDDYLAHAKSFDIDWLNNSEVKKALNL